MVTYTKALAEVVGDAIVASGQTVKGLADATGIPRTTLSRRLSGFSSFTVAELAAIAPLLDTSIETLTAAATERSAA